MRRQPADDGCNRQLLVSGIIAMTEAMCVSLISLLVGALLASPWMVWVMRRADEKRRPASRRSPRVKKKPRRRGRQ